MTDRRNVVLVTVDSLRADYCGFMGSDRGLTPNIDRYAQDGLVFRNAVTPGPSTLDALPGIFTGEDLVASGTDDGVRERMAHHLRARTTLPERFAEMGYETGAFTANPWTSRQFGFDRGFDHFEDFLDDADGDGGDDTDGSGSDGDGGALSMPVRLVRRWTGESSMFQAWGSFYDDVVAWTDQADEPYFLWLFLVDVHMPYLPVPGARSQPRPLTYAANLWLYLNGHEPGRLERAVRGPLVAAYEDTVRYTDDLFGSFVGDLADDPAVVVHADHGEAFGEGGVYGHGPTLSEEQIRVPLFVANGPTGEIDRPFSLRRLPDLCTALAEGREDMTPLTEPYVDTRNRDPTVAVRGRDWKYVDAGGDRAVYDVVDGQEPVTDRQGLSSVAADLVRAKQAHERERERVEAAAAAVAAESSL